MKETSSLSWESEIRVVQGQGWFLPLWPFDAKSLISTHDA
jgi:hypothetical protein